MTNEGINFFIHDIHPYGGQDRSTLEILDLLSENIPVHLYAYRYENPNTNSKIHFHRCPFPIRRPVLIKSVLFHLWSLWIFFRSPRRLTISTGTASLVSDIVHVQFLANAWKQEKNKVKIRKSWISKSYHKVLASYNEWMERVLYTPRKTYIALSQRVASDLKSLFGVEKVEVVYHGVDVKKFSPSLKKSELRKKLQLPEDKFLFLFVGAYDRKGLATVIQAAKKVRRQYPDACVVAVGSGDTESYYTFADDADASHWLYLREPSKSVENFYAAADAFVLPTLYEPFGLVILEAMSAALPVIVSRSAGAAELITQEKNGLILEDPTDTQELASAMEKLLRNRENSIAMGLAARKSAENRAWNCVAREFETVLKQSESILLVSYDYPPKRGGIATYTAELEEALRAAHCEVTVLTHPQNLSLIAASFFYFWKIQMALWKNPRLKIFCTNWFPCGVAAWLAPARWLFRAPFFVAAHGGEFLANKRNVKNWLKKKVIRKANLVFPVSSYTATKVSLLAGSTTKIKVIPNGVNTTRFYPTRSTNDGRKIPVVLTVSRLEPHKGIDTAIEALAILHKQSVPFEYWIAGTGKELSRLEATAKKLGVEKFVRFLGDVPGDELCALYNDCDLFLLLSRELPTFVEGFGLVFLEAAACGKTSVASRSGGIPDAVIDGETGILVSPDKPEEAARAIRKILSDSELRGTLERTAMERARVEMSWNNVAEQMKRAMDGTFHG